MARVFVVGPGAVGCYFGAQLLGAGHDVTFLGRAAHAAALKVEPLRIDSHSGSEQVSLDVTDNPGLAGDAELVLLCVKSHATASAARELGPHLQSRTRVLCMQNGVRNHELFETESKHVASPAVVYVAAEMQSPTHLVVNAPGSVVVGVPRGRTDQLEELVKLFESAAVPCRVSDFVERDLWRKLIINCAFNGISACTGAKYGAIMSSACCRELMEQIIGEAIAVANGLDIPLEFDAVKQATWKIGETMHAAISSTAQDVQRGKPTEIDFLNGEVVRAGKRLGIATPANHAILALVSLIEAGG